MCIQNGTAMAKNYFNRYIWLIDTIRQHDGISFQEISDCWCKSQLNETGAPLPERTFFNHRQAILETFDIDIRFDKQRGYYLSDESTDQQGVRSWLLNSLSVNNLVNECAGMRDRVLLEEIPSADKYLSVITEAMRESLKLNMAYRPFDKDEESEKTIAPYCLKLFKLRWYVLALPEGDSAPRIFALDRITALKPTDEPFEMPASFDAEHYFAGCFGIVVDEDVPVETVRLKVDSKQRPYFESRKLHWSQRETERHETWSIFEYRMAPTWDLAMDLLQYHGQVEVLSPASLRDLVVDYAYGILACYGEK